MKKYIINLLYYFLMCFIVAPYLWGFIEGLTGLSLWRNEYSGIQFILSLLYWQYQEYKKVSRSGMGG